MKTWILALLALVGTAEAAEGQLAVTGAFRGMVGGSLRLEHPVSPRVVALEDVGVSGWVVYGDSPDGTPSPTLLRTHLKVGADLAL